MSAEQRGRALAEDHRAARSLGLAPVADIIDYLESVEAIDDAVLEMPDGLSGMTRRDPESGRVVVATSTNDPPERQQFSLAHELGHILADDFTEDMTTVHTPSEAETRAHAFARHFLLPLAAASGMPNASSSEALIAQAVRYFRVSPQVAAIQLRAAGRITEAEKHEAAAYSSGRLAARYGWGAERAALVVQARQPRPPQRLVANSVQAYARGLLSAAGYARVRGVGLKTAMAELAEAGVASEPSLPEEDRRPAPDFEW